MRFPDFNDDWTPFFVGDIAKLGRGRVISNKEIQIQLKPLYPVYSSQTLNNGVMGYLDTFDFEGEYITWTTDGANAGTVFYRSGKFNCTNVCGILKLKSEFSHLFCALGLQKETKKFVSTNLANPKLMNNTMAKISLSIPSLAEQKKIADFLSLIDERIQSCSETIKELKTQKAGLLNQLFSQKLRFPDFNDEWTQTTLSEIAEILNSQRKPITSSDRISGDYPYYGASGIIDYVNAYIFDEELLLVGEDGAKWGKYEKTAFLVNGKYWVNNHAHVLRLPDISAYKFVESYLFFLNLKPFVTGDAPPKLTLESLKSIPIFMPSLAEQKKIADFLSLIDERIEVEEQLLKKYEEQKKYLLRHMFV